MTQHIGIVAVSAEGAALCYRTICVEGAALMGPHMHPEVTMHTFPLRQHMPFMEAGQWEDVAELMLVSARKLASVGADFLICPDNTAHQALPWVMPQSPLPWLHIAQEVAAEAVRQRYRRLGVMGTRYLMEGPVYPEKLSAAGVDIAIPNASDRARINDVIFDELVYGRFEDRSRQYFREVIERLAGSGCDAVVLGCTEIPLLISQSDSPLPTLDSTRILARAALRHAVEP